MKKNGYFFYNNGYLQSFYFGTNRLMREYRFYVRHKNYWNIKAIEYALHDKIEFSNHRKQYISQWLLIIYIYFIY